MHFYRPRSYFIYRTDLNNLVLKKYTTPLQQIGAVKSFKSLKKNFSYGIPSIIYTDYRYKLGLLFVILVSLGVAILTFITWEPTPEPPASIEVSINSSMENFEKPTPVSVGNHTMPASDQIEPIPQKQQDAENTEDTYEPQTKSMAMISKESVNPSVSIKHTKALVSKKTKNTTTKEIKSMKPLSILKKIPTELKSLAPLKTKSNNLPSISKSFLHNPQLHSVDSASNMESTSANINSTAYNSYKKTLQSQIQKYWKKQADNLPIDKSGVLVVSVEANGKLHFSSIFRSSHNQIFDDAMKSLPDQIEFVDPIPTEIRSKSLEFRIELNN
jgi:TonB C terminal